MVTSPDSFEFPTEFATGPPTALDLPWIPGWPGAGLLFLCVGGIALALWLDRFQERRVEPLALIALGLAVLGHGEAIRAAQATADPQHWPVNLARVALWVLLGASATSMLAWGRMCFSRRAIRGRILATCTLACSLGTAWIVQTFLVAGLWPAIPDDGIEVPVLAASRPDFLELGEYRPVIRVHADGARNHESMEALARRMTHRRGFPDDAILLRADRRARWSAVRPVLAEARDARIWRILFSARWRDPAVATQLLAFFPTRGFEAPDAAAREPAATVRVSEDGALWLDGEPCADLAELRERLQRLPRATEVSHERAQTQLRLEPDGSAAWGDVLAALRVAADECEILVLGPFALAVY